MAEPARGPDPRATVARDDAVAAQVAAATRAATERLRGRVLHTPLVPCSWLSDELGADVRLKLENVQHTGSFKVRGATHALLQLDDAARGLGVVAASSGNHGLGVAHAARALGAPAVVFVPTSTPQQKRDAIARLGAEVRVHGDDCVVTEAHARAFAAAAGRAYVSPYNDADVVAGQGTVAAELLQDWPEVEVVYVALGGGGLLGGMAAYGRHARPTVEWVGCSPAASPAMATCLRRGALLDVPCGPTWSDSTAGGVEPGAITFALCAAVVDRLLDVDEPAIAGAMRDALRHQHLLVEGAAGVAIAAARADGALAGRNAAVVVCGGNLPFDLLRQLLR